MRIFKGSLFCQDIHVLQASLPFLEGFLISLTIHPTREAWPISMQQLLLNGPQIVYNTEQLSRKHFLCQMSNLVQHEWCKEYWDYSKANIDLLKEKVPPELHSKIRQMPVQLPQEILEFAKKQSNSIPKEQDFSFCGTLTPYRKQILQELEKHFRVHVVQAFGFHNVIQECLKAKAVLNLHADKDYQIFETVRCNVFLDAGIPVFTERSLDTDPRARLFDIKDLSNLTSFVQSFPANTAK